MSMTPAGTSTRSLPGVRGWIRPCSSPKVTMPIVPWPHIGRQPDGLDEEDADIGIGLRRRVEEPARHHVVPARLEAETGANPVEPLQEVLRRSAIDPP
jgi:hypothetical protein